MVTGQRLDRVATPERRGRTREQQGQTLEGDALRSLSEEELNAVAFRGAIIRSEAHRRGKPHGAHFTVGQLPRPDRWGQGLMTESGERGVKVTTLESPKGTPPQGAASTGRLS